MNMNIYFKKCYLWFRFHIYNIHTPRWINLGLNFRNKKLARSINMFKKISLVAIGAFGAFAFGAFTPSNSNAQGDAYARPLPGNWKFDTKAAGFINESDTHCLSQAEIDRFYANPCKKNTVCTYSTKSFAPDGSVKLVGTWVDKKKRVSKINTNGTFKPDFLRLKGNVTYYNIPIPITFEAKRVSAQCR